MAMRTVEVERAGLGGDFEAVWGAVRAQAPMVTELREAIGDGVPFPAGLRLCLLRHGETVTNALGIVTGSADVHLTERGRRQAVEAGGQLRGYELRAAWTSTMQRSRETLDIVLEAAGASSTPRAVDERLGERSLGYLEGRKSVHVPEFAAGDLDYAPEGGENYRGVAQRVLSFLFDLAHLPAPHVGDVVVSSHQGPLRIFESLLDPARTRSTAEVLGQRFENAHPRCVALDVLTWPDWLD